MPNVHPSRQAAKARLLDTWRQMRWADPLALRFSLPIWSLGFAAEMSSLFES